MTVSVFDLFSIGLGPSSSHTVGPMRAAYAFARQVQDRIDRGYYSSPEKISITLYGSLAATGAGHGTLGACLLGLDGADPGTVDPDYAQKRLKEIENTGLIRFAGIGEEIPCGLGDITLKPQEIKEIHTNAVTFSAWGSQRSATNLQEWTHEETYYSIGGGFIRTKDATPQRTEFTGPYSFNSGADLIDKAEHYTGSIADIQRACEESVRSEEEVNSAIDHLVSVMRACVERGMTQQGTLPGGLGVQRRAHLWKKQLDREDPHCTQAFSEDWINLIALAVNEENAAGGRIVTAPTNGAAGIIPAVLFYAQTFTPQGQRNPQTIARQFILAAGAIGSLYKERASISGAEVGCQGEVGSAASMAAAGLAEILGGTPSQVANAAEIAMEHSLGLTCDPIGGLVQIPCIERNAISAGKAINAAKMALRGNGEHRVSLDEVIETMRRTGLDMSDKYKETAAGGLARTVSVNITEC